MKLSLKDLDVKGKKVLMRVDFNVPVDDAGKITDDSRITSTLPSIHYVLENGGALIIMCHFGRPKGKPNPTFSVKPLGEHLSKLLEKKVLFAPDCVGDEAEEMANSLKQGEVLLLENLRFHIGEEKPDQEIGFAKSLANLGDIYVDDAFGAAHRKHASIVEVPKFFPEKCAMGLLMEKEYRYMSEIAQSPKRPFYVITGGAKIGTKLGILKSLLKKVDGIFVGGGMVFTFLKAIGMEIGDSICSDEMLDDAKTFLEMCRKENVPLYFPEDFVITNDQEVQNISKDEPIKKGWKGMDIGLETVKSWSDALSNGATVFWNGPMGVFEMEPFAQGTKGLAQNLSCLPGDVIVGGGDSVAAIKGLHLEEKFTHLSTGGGASLEFIEFGKLPGIDALTNK